MSETSVPRDPNRTEYHERTLRYRAAEELAGTLDRLGSSLLVSTYQAGRVVVLGVH
jgi:hypothetical protein